MELNQQIALTNGYRSMVEIIARIREIEERLSYIEECLLNEQQRPFFERRVGMCRFLDMEKIMYSAMLKELKWVIDA